MGKLKEQIEKQLLDEGKKFKVKLFDPLLHLTGKPLKVLFTGTKDEIDAWAKKRGAKKADGYEGFIDKNKDVLVVENNMIIDEGWKPSKKDIAKLVANYEKLIKGMDKKKDAEMIAFMRGEIADIKKMQTSD